MPETVMISVSSEDGYTLFMVVERGPYAKDGPHEPHVTYMVTGPNNFCVSSLSWDNAVNLFTQKTTDEATDMADNTNTAVHGETGGGSR